MAYSRGTKLEDATSERIVEIAMGMALRDGIGKLTVRKIISEMNCTNRVFYNRFKNIEDVFRAMYGRIVDEMRKCIQVEYDGSCDYYEFLMNIAVCVLEKTYKNKLHFSQYMFEYDSYNDSNRNWWIEHMMPILQYGVDNGLVKQMDLRLLCYSIWCFCRGFNAATVGTVLNIDDVTASFKIGFGCLIDGLKPIK